MKVAGSRASGEAPVGAAVPGRLLGGPELLAAAGLAFLYAAVMAGHLSSFDGTVMFWQAMSLALKHSLHFAWPVPATGFTVHDSKYGIGLSLLYVPGILLVHLLDPGLVTRAIPSISPESWKLFTLTGSSVQIAIGVATALLVAATIRALGGSSRLALGGLLLYGIASPAIVYARLDYAQPLDALCILLSLFSSLMARKGGWGWPALAGLAVGYGVLTRPVETTIVVPAVVVIAGPAWKRLAVGGGVGWLAGAVLTLLVNWLRFGDPLTTGYAGEGFTTPLLVGLLGSLLSPARGLLWELPIVFLLPSGILALWRRGQRRVALGLAYVCLALLVMVAKWDAWWGGYDWGLRLYIPAMPVAMVLGVLGIPSLGRRAAPWVVGAIALAGALWALPGVIENGFWYGGFANGTAESWQLSAYPPLGAWQFLHGWLGHGPVGQSLWSVDILWLSISRTWRLQPIALLPAFFMVAVVLLGLAIRSRWWSPAAADRF